MKCVIIFIILITLIFFLCAINRTKDTTVIKTSSDIVVSGFVCDDAGNIYEIKSKMPLRINIEDDGKMWRVYFPGLIDSNGKLLIETYTSNTKDFTVASANNKLIRYVYTVLIETPTNKKSKLPHRPQKIINDVDQLFAIKKTNMR